MDSLLFGFFNSLCCSLFVCFFCGEVEVLYFLKLELVILSSSLSSFLMAQLGKEVVLTFYCCFIASSTNVKFSFICCMVLF